MPMRQAHATFDIRTPGRGLVEITPQVTRWLAGTGIISVPVVDGRLVLGTWQGIYVYEHRRRGHAREVVAQVMGM